MSDALPQRHIGDREVAAIGMGAMTLTQTLDHNPNRAIAVVEAALEAGVTLFDTADCYGPTSEMGVNELALITALRSIPGALDVALVTTKGGHTRGPNATWWINGTPKHIASAARASLARLGLDSLPLYQHHRPDPRVPYAETMGAFLALVDEGLVQRVGVSNVSLNQLNIAHEVLGSALVSVQNEFSPVEGTDEAVLARSEELGITFLAWGPFGGMRQAKQLTDAPGPVAEIANERGVSPWRVTLAWLLAQSPCVIPIPGASRPESIRDSALAAHFTLDTAELQRLNERVSEGQSE